ncbi:hypothetical protein POM88_051380 [Heracleum sosnowskyi]|uniref:DNA-directed RNA polymerase n=1 Tax=Heracleum sosnowskyi TaxID=360622 RepID=A0AAD8H1L2_9APIA|nr:hypothetical protein POM88_051380 [Heracleum sosnowskyi]
MRRTLQHVNYTGRVGDARYPLHPSRWGKLCFLSTPDRKNCGLKKNLASTGIVDSTSFVTELRNMRRSKELPHQVEIKRDDQNREISQILQIMQFDTEKVKLTRSNARDISSFFTKKINRENEPQGQASEPPAPESSRIFTPPGPPQISAQSSSPSVNVPEAELDVLTLAHDPGKRKKMRGSSKRKEFLREKQAIRVVEALSLGELETGSGLNQERGLGRPSDTRWGSHFKTILNVLDLYPTILESLDAIAEVSDTVDSNKAQSIIHLLMSFDFVFVAHLMVAIFGITNELNVALQRHDQDIVNAMSMVDITKTSLQKMRDGGWDSHLDKVTSFMLKYGVEIPNMEETYLVPGRRMYRGKRQQMNDIVDRYQNMKSRRDQL